MSVNYNLVVYDFILCLNETMKTKINKCTKCKTLVHITGVNINRNSSYYYCSKICYLYDLSIIKKINIYVFNSSNGV